ncbi:MAG: bifunctional diaminohydroxyphosphoribosylaminopyrimidine deaminase/5-amino-6-(5-phosphoribosylamino)uracil reductase RibD [Verrucomicrobia bacterium]|nr:bifunctional diaminohydroxyphosphoribosylaminopyrimidine deaminase/5-amino-6-(5-phosphoribosylamino)uracil reductase RibD [Verrucomicrobiota bacterium]
MRRALQLARHGVGRTSPNPSVGAVLVRGGKVIGEGWHRRAGLPHAEVEAMRDAARRGERVRGATLFVTLEPCCTHGRTPPCTQAILAAGIRRVVVAAADPNPRHAGKGLELLRKAGVVCRLPIAEWAEQRAAGGGANSQTAIGKRRLLALAATRLNEAFNHWIERRTPFVTVKAAMTLDGKIATAAGESKWITGERSRQVAMRLRFDSDAVLVGINTVLADNPGLTARAPSGRVRKPPRRFILDAFARTPPDSVVVSDQFAALTTVVVSRAAPARRVKSLAQRTRVLVAPARGGRINLRWLLKRLGSEDVTSLLVEGGGEVNAAFLEAGLAQRVAFFYAPKILGGRDARRGVAGAGARRLADLIELREIEWRRAGEDLWLSARVGKEQG